MRTRTGSLRSTLATATLVLAALGLVVSGTLVALTTHLQRTSAVLAAEMRSVHLTEEAEITLLLYGRATSPTARSKRGEELRYDLSLALGQVSTAHEGRLLQEASSRVDDYLAQTAHMDRPTPESALREQSAYEALEALADENLALAAATREDADRWDRRANILGAASAVPLLAVAVWLVRWLRVMAVRPLFELAGAMERFGAGDRSVRAPDVGAVELREMADRFNAMASALAAQRDVQMAFLAGVAHDLRNPLSALRMSVDGLRPDKPLPAEARIRRLVEVVSRQLTRMERMVGDFLDMAKIEAGKLDLFPEERDVRELVRETVELFADTSALHTLDVRLPDSAVPVRCDPLRVEQVMVNLVSNAIKYSPAGGPVTVTLEREGGEAVLQVRDPGVGMSEDEQRHIFEPFQRGAAQRGTVPGVGLGLFVVKRIVESHAGHIEVESAPGAGSTFRVRLPLSPGGDTRSPTGAGDPPAGERISA